MTCGSDQGETTRFLPFVFKALFCDKKGSFSMPNIDLDYLAKQNDKILEELSALRREVTDLRATAGQSLEIDRRTDPRRPSGLSR